MGDKEMFPHQSLPVRAWTDDSVGKLLAVGMWQPELRCPAPMQNPVTQLNVSNTHCWGRDQQIPRACWTAAMDTVKTGSCSFRKRPCLKIKVKRDKGRLPCQRTPHSHRHRLQVNSESTQWQALQRHSTVVRWQDVRSLVKLSYTIKSL